MIDHDAVLQYVPVASLTQQWLVMNLRTAALQVGCPSWWSLEDIAVAIRQALLADVPPSHLRLADLQNRISAVLLSIGCAELAGSFRLIHPVLRLSLADCTRDPALQSEEELFTRLRSRLDVIRHGGIQHLHLTDLSAWKVGLPALDGAFPWHTPAVCRARIVIFVRRHLCSLSLPQPICCLMS